jgi:hypothetical protein
MSVPTDELLDELPGAIAEGDQPVEADLADVEVEE